MRIRRTMSMLIWNMILCTIMYSQTDTRIPQVVPPSPNAAAIQKYGELSVNAYTGAPNISIPLYTITAGSLSVPVSISYNPSGIKVADEASRVGLGWVLNAGGAISRTVVGKDDFDANGYSYHNQSIIEIPKAPRFDQGSNFNIKEGCDVTLSGYGINYTIPSTVFSDGGNYDLQPDTYAYNFNGHSGKFILRRNRDVVLNNIEKIDIKPIGTDANSWEIKTPDGVLHKFEQFETYVDDGGTGQPHKSSWYITKIISPKGDSVIFNYTSLSAYIHTVGSFFESKPGVNLAANSSTQTAPSPLSYYSAPVPGKWYSNLCLSKISFNTGEVIFNYAADRLDVEGDLRLTNVQVYAKRSGEANKLMKTWNFNYGYFNGQNYYGGYNPNVNENTLSKRLKLSSVQEASGLLSLPPYEFFYNDEYDNVTSLPGKLSFARDHWGYYNGRTLNSSLIPTFANGCNSDPVAFYLGVMSYERNPDPRFNQIFSLNKIRYPTGGYTSFEYETHDFDITNSAINDHSYFANYAGSRPAFAEAGFSNIQAGGSFTATIDMTGMVDCGQTLPFVATFIKISGGLQPGSGITYSLKDPSGIEVSGGYIDSYLGSITPPMTEYLGTQQRNSGLKLTLNRSFVPGLYTWTINVPSNVGLTASGVNIYYSRTESRDPIVNSGDTVYNALFGGGLRIRRIKDFADTSAIPTIKKYNYHFLSNGKIYSYGRRMSRPNYSYFTELTGVAGENPVTGQQIIATSNILVRESDSNIPLNGSAGGSTVGYDKVEELLGENGEGGKTVYEYQNQPDLVQSYTQFKQVLGQVTNIPRKPPYGGSVSSAGNGNLLRQTDYAFTGGIFKPVREITNTYQDLVPTTANAAVLGIEKRANAGSSPFLPQNCYITNFIYPAITQNRPVLTASESKQYDMNTSTLAFSTTTEYVYDTSTHLQLISKTEYRSNGDKLTTNIKYPLDYTDPQTDAAILRMKGSAYMHAMPVMQQTSLTRGTNQWITNATINKYQLVNGKVLDKEKVLFQTDQPLSISSVTPYNPSSGVYPAGFVPRVFFDNYDANGNIIQLHKSDDVPVSYIWGYGGTYPVAEITNATANSCAYSSFEADEKGNWSYTGASLIDATAFTGKKIYPLSSGDITISGLDPTKEYVVSYWSRSGPASVNETMSVLVQSRLGWNHCQHSLPIGTTAITISGAVTIDELRLFPKNAMMTTYTYEPLAGISSQCDANNSVTYYEYDEFQRLKSVRDQNKNVLKMMEYKYRQ